MRLLAKPVLWMMTAVFPVFIAACYGAFYEEGYGRDHDDDDDHNYALRSIPGRVLSALTGSGIPYIKVTCLRDSEQGIGEHGHAYSGPGDGAFELWMSENSSCDQLRFEDVDGEDNGSYATLIVDYEDDGEEVVVELSPTE